ncbi:MAG: DUF2288 domain-containing protein [Thermosynechococcaceae cyanobacterium MS004]|nr:DUF2288 domain-containing protein [Thermosynechococcaceae cyanobacterium MS004]
MTSIREQLIKDKANIEWEALIPHSQRDSVIFVHEGLDLVEVALAIAEDNTAQVEVWIAEQLIQKPTAQQLSQWNQDPAQCFSALIVQPYVLMSTVRDPE